jgi:hypothetical protein
LIASGPAKNKSRIVTGGIVNPTNSAQWILTLDKPWFSPFTKDETVPTSASTYTLGTTNPNLLVKEESQGNLLFLYDQDNPASYNDPRTAGPRDPPGQENPFGAGRIFFDNSAFGPRRRTARSRRSTSSASPASAWAARAASAARRAS